MGATLGCRMKQKRQKCPYQKIKEVETTIERAKCTLHFMEEKTKKLEKLLKKGDVQALYELEQIYHDGFLWQEHLGLEVSSVVKQLQCIKIDERIKFNCPYIAETCEDVLVLKTSRSRFFRKKITQMTQYYNEVLSLLKEMLLYHKQYSVEKENLFTYFQTSSRPWLMYFNLEIFQPMAQNHYLISFFYFDEKVYKVIQSFIECYYDPNSTLLQGTSFAKMHQKVKLLQLALPQGMNRIIQKEIVQGTEQFINVLNHRYGKRYGKLKGCYILLTDYHVEKQIELIKDLGPLGYKVLGKMTSSGEFVERQILIHLIHALE